MPFELHYRDPRASSAACIKGIPDLTDLRRVLEELQQKYLAELDHPIGVDLQNEHGDYLHVGLGKDRWTVAVTKMQDEVPSEQFWAIGDPGAEGWDAVYFDQYTPVAREEWLPADLAWQVVGHWLRTGGLSDATMWRRE